MSDYAIETLYKGVNVQFENTKTLYEDKGAHHHLILFENPIFGRVLMLDHITQVTLLDEFIYHEMMTHTPILFHKNPENILIIGGGDGGIAREVLKHKNIKHVDMVEIDHNVVDFSVQYLPEISDGCFDDPRLKLHIADGAQFVKNTDSQYDVIIVDSTDPQGPGEVLFTHEFYTDCHNILTPEGILVTQNGVPFMQGDELTQSVSFFRDIFKVGTCYRATIPTYAFGEMAMGFASHLNYPETVSLDILRSRFHDAKISTRYYTPDIHLASFALPAYIQKLIA